jgi:hypothetical protein
VCEQERRSRGLGGRLQAREVRTGRVVEPNDRAPIRRPASDFEVIDFETSRMAQCTRYPEGCWTFDARERTPRPACATLARPLSTPMAAAIPRGYTPKILGGVADRQSHPERRTRPGNIHRLPAPDNQRQVVNNA